LDWVESAMIVALLAGLAAGVFNHAQVIRNLRERHPDTWQMLGAPTLIRNNSISNSRRLRAYIKRSEYKALGDSALDRTIRVGRVIEWGYLVVLVLFGLRFVAALAS